jgi:cation transporter-like permease
MATDTLCGNCGAVLSGPMATCTHCGSTAAGGPQARTWTRSRKSPAIAVALAAVIPGMGHVYLGHYKKGLGYLVGTGALEFFGLDLDLTGIGLALGIPMELGGLGLWAHGVWDAYRIAKRLQY